MAATRRLAAIMFTDMVGSTALAQIDEPEALRLRDEQEQLVRPLFAAHQGREVKSMGDGFLAEFESALHATLCAVEIQQRLNERNSRSARTPIQLRIGIHLGDVEVRGLDIFGDSVNVASRIEPLADPGGICVTEPVFGQVRNKIAQRFEKLTPRTLKNVQFPFDVYRIQLAWATPTADPAGAGPPGIAVLPFANISPDPNDAYFADGLTEELITVLSQVGGLRVIARTSVMPYRSTSKGVALIGQELKVSSILEGSVRKAGSRLRVTAQLIDVTSEDHVWAKSFDQELNDVFAIQAEIAKQVAEALRVELKAGEVGRLQRRPAVERESYEAYLRGRELVRESASTSVEPEKAGFVKIDARDRARAKLLERAKTEFERAVSLDPTNAAAYSGLADATLLRLEFLSEWDLRLPREQVRQEARDAAREWITKALSLNPELAEGYASLGYLLMTGFGRRPEALDALERAVSLNPSNAQARTWYADMLYLEGRPEDALREIRLAEAADPISAPSRISLTMNAIGIPLSGESGEVHLGIYWALTGREDKAREILERLRSLAEVPRGTSFLVGVLCAYLGEIDESIRWLGKAVALREGSPVWWREGPGLESLRKDPRFQALIQKVFQD